MSSNSPQQADQPTPERIEDERPLGQRLYDAVVSAAEDLVHEPWATLPADVRGRFARAAQRFLKGEAASALASPPTAPEGDWVLVPRIPTEAMNSAGFAEWNRTRAGSVDLIYRAMLASAPPPPQEWREQAARDLGRVANLLEYRMYTEDNMVRENTRRAIETCQRVQALLARLGPPPQAGPDSPSRDHDQAVSALGWRPIESEIQRLIAERGVPGDPKDKRLVSDIMAALANYRAASQGSAE